MTHDMNFVISSNLTIHQQRLNDLQSWTESLLILADTSISARDKTTMTNASNASILKCFIEFEEELFKDFFWPNLYQA